MTTVQWVITFGGYLLTLLLIPRLLLQNKQSVSTVAWTILIILLPYAGALLYLVFGINRVERRLAHKYESSRRIGPLLPELTHYQLLPGEGGDPQRRRLMLLANRLGSTRPTLDNRIELLNDTNKTLGLIEQAILSAEHSLHLEYYIWQPDRTGTRIRDLLIRKVQDGVAVRFLFDGLGSMLLSRKFLKPMIDAGIEVATFLPGSSFRERWSINLRSHRKIVIVDGQIGFTGGMNIGDEYIGRNRKLGYWRDTHLRMQGPAVMQLQQVFADDWYFATGKKLTDRSLYPKPRNTGSEVAQVVSSGPDDDFNAFHALFFAAIADAEKSVTLATSYFVPTEPLMAALTTAAFRGVRVRLLLSGRGAYPWMLWAGRAYYDALLKAGVQIYEYQKGLLHSKTLCVDGNWSVVGTANFDVRSLLLNFEVGVVVYGTEMALSLESAFAKDLASAQKIIPTEWQNRGLRSRLVENSLKLFSPVL